MTRSLLLFAALALAVPAASQTGTFTTYGSGCGGSGGPCVSANDSSPITLGSVTGASAKFAILSNTGASNRIITGFGLYTNTRLTSPTSVDCWIYDATAAGTPNQILASTTIQMTATASWQKTGQLLDPANQNIPFILMPMNTAFFIVFDNAQALTNPLPVVASGTQQTHFWNGPPTWSGPWSTQRWVYQVYCLGGSTAPKLANTGVPTINSSAFSIDLSAAAANANSILAIGVAKTNIDLAIAGAPGCSLYTNPLILVPGPVDAAGNRAVTLPIPNDPALVNFQFYSQFAVNENANNLGLVWTEGGEGKIGR